MSTFNLSVIIPAYDELVNLQKGVLEKVEHFLSKQKYTSEVVIVDDGSTDGTIEYVEKFTSENPRFKLIKNSHVGKAGAVTAGMLAAKGKYVLFADMDQATPIEEIEKLLPVLEEGYDIAVGSRGVIRKGSPLSRKIISIGLIIMRKAIVGISDVSDTNCGFKAFKHDVAQKLFKKIYDLNGGFKQISGSAVKAGFDVELLFVAEKMGYKIKEVPVNWLYVETRRVSPLRDSIDGVEDLIRIRINDLQHKY